MTEEITVAGGHIQVKRVNGKPDVDLIVEDITRVYFERAVRDQNGALVLVDSSGRQTVIRVDNEDATEALALVNGALNDDEESAEGFDLQY